MGDEVDVKHIVNYYTLNYYVRNQGYCSVFKFISKSVSIFWNYLLPHFWVVIGLSYQESDVSLVDSDGWSDHLFYMNTLSTSISLHILSNLDSGQ